MIVVTRDKLSKGNKFKAKLRCWEELYVARPKWGGNGVIVFPLVGSSVFSSSGFLVDTEIYMGINNP